jgi:hypothetical protein
VLGERRDETVDTARARAGGAGNVRPFLAVGVALVAGVVDDEVDVGEGGGRRPDVARRCRRDRRVGDRSTEALVTRDHARTERAHPLEEREAHFLVVEEPAARG